MLAATAESRRLDSPFPGLRSFSQDESELFFGREGQCDELARILGKSHFVAVVGTSGSGKSSLVRAGLLPSLESGYLAKAGSGWRFVDMRPGSRPIDNLANAIHSAKVSDTPVDPALLRGSSLALLELAREAYQSGRLDAGENLLILVDQFEELFRFKARDSSMSDRDEKTGFVKLLLEVSRQTELPVYVVITMRSDFLGDCARFRDLPEAINGGQYLIPRMTREQRREAVEGPIQMAGGTISSRLLQRILNEVGDDPDQLPVMQHALMRTWRHWIQQGHTDIPIDIDDYEAIGSLANALSSHADEAYAEACSKVPDGCRIARLTFQRLRERDSPGRETRRPTPFHELCAVAEASPEQVLAVLECFRRDGRTFLMPPAGVALAPDREIDITHESLLRQWTRLQGPPSGDAGWLAEEEESRRTFLRLVDRAEQQIPENPDYLRGPLLQFALDWWNKRLPNAAWAERYSPSFELAGRFLRESEQNREREHELESQRLKSEEAARLAQARREEESKARQLKTRWANVFAVLALLVAIGTVLGFWYLAKQRQAADTASRALSLERQKTSEQQAAEALSDSQKAEAGKNLALELEAKAEGERQAAEKAEKAAVSALRIAEAERGKASIQLLASKAALVGTEDESMLPVSMLLAAESMRRQPLIDNQSILSAGLALLPKPVPLLANVSGISRVAFAPGGLMAVGQADAIRVLDPRTGKEVGKFAISGSPGAMAISPDGALLGAAFASGGHDVIRVWDLRTGAQTGERVSKAPVSYLHVAANGKVMAFDTELEYRYWGGWSDSEGSLHGAAVLASGGAVAASSDLTSFASYSSGASTIKVENLVTGEEIWSWPMPEQIHDLIYDPSDNKRIATFADNGTIKIWTVGSRQATLTLQAGTRPTESTAGIQFSANGQFLGATRFDGTVRVWDTREAREVARAFIKPGASDSVAVDGANRLIALTEENSFHLWQMSDLPLPEPVVAAQIGVEGARAALRPRRAGFLSIWNVAKGQVTDSVDLSPFKVPLAINPDQNLVAGLSVDRRSLYVSRIENAKTLTLLRSITSDIVPILTAPVFSRDGRFIAGGFHYPANKGGAEGVAVWDTGRNTDPVIITGPELPGGRASAGVSFLGFTPDSDRCILRFRTVDGKPGDVKLWDFRKRSAGPAPAQFQAPFSNFSFSPDGQRLATFNRPVAQTRAAPEQRTAITVWQWPDADKPVKLDIDAVVSQMSFSSDHKFLLTTGTDRFVRIWDLATGKEAGRVTVQRPLATGFAAGDRRILTFGTDYLTDSLWRPEDLLKETCARLGRSLTEEEWKRYLPSEPYQKTCEAN